MMKSIFSLVPLKAQSNLDDRGRLSDIQATGLSLDSRKVKPGDLFLAYPGAAADGRHYIAQAIEKGAVAVFREDGSTKTVEWQEKVPIIAIKNLGEQVSGIAGEFYDHPSKAMEVMAVTGTNGKTSVTHLLAEAFTRLGKLGAVIGTMGSRVGFEPYNTDFKTTTPDPITLQAILRQFKDRGVNVVAMEASSHALHQHRLAAVSVGVGIFTNLTRDHLDYHQSMENYAEAKRFLFEMPSLRLGVFNGDDPAGAAWAKLFQHRYPSCAYMLQEAHPLGVDQLVRAGSPHFLSTGFRCDVETPWGKGKLTSSLLGRFNIQNMLAVLAVLGLKGYSLETILPVLAALKPIRGRMQILGGEPGEPLVVIDYAHTPDALEKILNASREHCRGKLTCVFGCGGDRDKGKRPIMGKIAERYADRVIITDDNVRHENPLQIVKDILAGCVRPDTMRVLSDRREAIQTALKEAVSGDVIVLAGKGHETYQIVGDRSWPFSEEAVVLEILRGIPCYFG